MPPRKQPQDRKAPAKKTTSRAPAKRASSARSNGATREPDVHFDLDSLEREGEQLEPFTFRHGDKYFTLADPAELELEDLVALGETPAQNPVLLRKLMGEDYDEVIASGSFPQWKLIPLLQAYYDYYGIGQPGKYPA